ncbi:MAG: hypothetical protein HY689_13225 [Chloroflexi bacterium]|nr:hypothetical protein [Chloroflexota bacterium]
MATRKPSRGKPSEPARTPPGAAALAHLLDRMDEAVLAADQAQVMDLMEQLWPSRRQVPGVLAQRLSSGQARVPAFAFELLEGFAGLRAKTHLRRIAQDQSAPDLVRFGAQRRSGWPERGEAKRRLAFLASFRDADGTLVAAVKDGAAMWPPDGDVFQEVLGYLVVLPVERQQALVTRFAREVEIGAGWLLHAIVHLDAPAVQRAALDELVRMREPGAAGAIARLESTTRDAGLRADTAAALQRLRIQVVDPSQRVEFPPFPPVERALLSIIDGGGSQAIVVVRRWGDGVFLLADFWCRDDWGIRDTIGLSRVVADQLQEVLEEFEAEGVDLVEVDLAAVRGALAGAVALNAATGHRLPPVFECWEPLVHEAYPPPEGEPVVAPELEDAPYAARQDLVRSSGRLLDHAFFASWGFDPGETSQAMAGVPPPRGGRWTDRQYRPLVERLVDPQTCARLRQRLRRQAWLLERSGDTPQRDLALATAASLSGAGPADLVKHPFVRTLVQRSVEDVLAEALAVLPFPPLGPEEETSD